MRKGFTLIELMIVIAIIAIIAAIAIPNLLESRVTANEAAASASLKSGVFPAQVQFQAGGYQDLDADNVGEYGTLRALAGLQPTNKIVMNSIRLLQGPLATNNTWVSTPSAVPADAGAILDAGPETPGYGVASGYAFTAFVASQTTPGDETNAPAGASIWVDGEPAPTTLTATYNCNNGEKYWIAVAAPERFGDSGRRPFCISDDGQVRSPATANGVAVFFSTVNMIADPTWVDPGDGSVAPQIPDPANTVTVTQGTALKRRGLSVGAVAIYGGAGNTLMSDDFNLWANPKSTAFPVYAK